ncbi:MAG: DUF3352 domain-containing protein [Synechococcales cyanobacterium C42_A2020_086]|nr:DUF3352 domain-containing protein [Synechococcales cyanobacterium C42_A2020_086]
MVGKLFKQRKSALWLALGTAAGFAIGGVTAWWFVQRRPTTAGLPTGTTVIPQEAVMTVSVSTDRGQWQQLRRFGTPETQAAFDRTLAQWRDRLLTANGLSYQQDIQPWVGNEITAALLLPPTDAANAPADAPGTVQPYDPTALVMGEQALVFVLPIADPAKAQQLLSSPQGDQDAVARDYKGVQIREVHNQTERAYAASVLGNRFVVVSDHTWAVEQVIDTFKGEASVAATPGYSQALGYITAANPFAQIYVNVPAATTFTSNNAIQPIPPQLLVPIQANRGLASTVTLESEGLRMQGVTWLAPNSKTRFRVINNTERMPQLLPSETLLTAMGGNLKQLWQNYTEQPPEPLQTVPKPGFLNPDTLRQGLRNLTGLDLDNDVMPWTAGEFALGLVSAPAAAGSTSKAGVVVMVQASDRRAADQTFQRLDEIMRERYRFQVSEAEIGGQSVVNWVSPFTALTVSRGWLDGNIAFLAIGPDLASTFLPAPAQSLADNEQFRAATSTQLEPNNGHFFIELDRLANPENLNLPLPALSEENRAFLKAIRAIGLTAALQDGRTTQYDVRVLMRKGDAPGALPPPALPAAPSPTEASPAP